MKVAFFLAYVYTKAPFSINIATKLQSQFQIEKINMDQLLEGFLVLIRLENKSIIKELGY